MMELADMAVHAVSAIVAGAGAYAGVKSSIAQLFERVDNTKAIAQSADMKADKAHDRITDHVEKYHAR